MAVPTSLSASVSSYTGAPCPENRAGFSIGIPWMKFGKTEQ